MFSDEHGKSDHVLVSRRPEWVQNPSEQWAKREMDFLLTLSNYGYLLFVQFDFHANDYKSLNIFNFSAWRWKYFMWSYLNSLATLAHVLEHTRANGHVPHMEVFYETWYWRNNFKNFATFDKCSLLSCSIIFEDWKL